MKRLPLGFLCLAVSSSSAAPIQWTAASGGNDHFYEHIQPGGFINWNAANTAATSRLWLGQPGYLATVTSSAENAFVLATFSTPGLWAWLGGFQDPNSAEPSGGWRWVTGEPGPVAPHYTNWGPGSPNNIFGDSPNEDRISLESDGRGSQAWNDLPAGFGTLGYIVEYDTPASIPEPSSIALVVAGLAATKILRQRKLAGSYRKARAGPEAK